MKKYTNITHEMLCVELEGIGQFLTRGQSFESDAKEIRVPKGILVETVGQVKVKASKPKKSASKSTSDKK